MHAILRNQDRPTVLVVGPELAKHSSDVSKKTGGETGVGECESAPCTRPCVRLESALEACTSSEYG